MSSPSHPESAPAIRTVNKSSYHGPFFSHNGTRHVPVQCYIESDCMRSLSRVVWSEGMYLGPHHFQVQSRYFEDSIHFAASSLWYAGHGLAGVELDADALQNGTIPPLHARALSPDGLPLNMPEGEPLPAVHAIGDHFPPTRDGIV